MKKREAKWYIENALKPPKAFFDWCYSNIPTYKWSNKKETILASDRKNCSVVEKRLTKNSKLTFSDKFYSFAIVLVTSKRIEIQSYSFWSRIKDGKQTIESDLSNFEQFSNGQHVEVTKCWNQKYCFGLTSNYGGWSGAYAGTSFYQNDWAHRIKNISELRYIKFRYLDLTVLDNIYKYKKEIEFLQKINARKLSDEVMYPSYRYSGCGARKNVDMRTINEKWLRKNKQFFKNSDRSFMEYELERRIKQRNGTVVPGIEKFLEYRDINKIPRGVGIIRFQNWAIKNNLDFDYYMDYLGMLKDLNLDPTGDENLILPKDLRKAHDNAIKLLNQLKREKERLENEERQKEYSEQLKKRSKIETEIDQYMFVLPKELNEIIIEGKALHHCVGSSSYIERHQKGKTTIVFIRQKENPQRAFFTLEYRNGMIQQLRGKHNQLPSEEVRSVADKWLAWVNGGCKHGKNKIESKKEKPSAA